MTAQQLFHLCRRAGIALAEEGGQVVCRAPEGVEIPVDDIRQLKPELLAALSGDYFAAARELVMRIADPHEREALAEVFEERAGICQFDGNMSRGDAEWAGYIELARAVERAALSNSIGTCV
jgi:hypothetical protein